MGKPHIAVISHGRPENVLKLQKVVGSVVGLTWYVNIGEGAAYKAAGALKVVECGTNICQARNKAIKEAGKNWCVQVSDDLKSIKQISIVDGLRVKRPVHFLYVVSDIIKVLERNAFKFGGVAVTDNALNYTGQDYSFSNLIVNDLIIVAPGNYFDNEMALKEDYDMCIKELIYSGGVVRANKFLCTFPHRENKGGANMYRNSDTEGDATEKLFRKWGPHVKKHPTRPGQISLNYKQIKLTRDELIRQHSTKKS